MFYQVVFEKNSQQQNTCPALQFWLKLGATLSVLTGHLALHSRLSFYQIHFSFKLPNHVIMFSSVSIFFEPPVKGKVVHAGQAFFLLLHCQAKLQPLPQCFFWRIFIIWQKICGKNIMSNVPFSKKSWNMN